MIVDVFIITMAWLALLIVGGAIADYLERRLKR
jgi:hypothetical protein